MAQAWNRPPDTAVNVPDGGFVSPNQPSPQQLRVPSIEMAHVKLAPAETIVNCPLGGDDTPKSVSPQQRMVRSVVSAHVWRNPVVTAIACCEGIWADAGRAPRANAAIAIVTTRIQRTDRPT